MTQKTQYIEAKNRSLRTCCFIVFWISCLLFSVEQAQAQPERISVFFDSVKVVYRQAEDVDTKLKALQDLAGSYANRNVDSCLKYARIGEKLARQSDRKAMMLRFLVIRSNAAPGPKEALTINIEVAGEAAQINDTSVMVMSNGSIANNYRDMSDYQAAIRYNIKATRLAEAAGLYAFASITNNNLGSVYRLTGRYEEGLQAHKRAKKYALLSGKMFHVIKCDMSIAGACNELDQPDSATVYFTKALSLAKEFDSKSNISMALTNLADIETNKGNWHPARQYYKEAVGPGEAFGGAWQLFNIYEGTALVMTYLNEPDSAYYYIAKAEAALPEPEDLEQRMSLKKVKMRADSLTGKYLSSMAHQNEYVRLLRKWSDEATKKATHELTCGLRNRKEGR